MCPTNGLVSILKRRVSEEGEASPTESSPKRTAGRKVRFSEPSEGKMLPASIYTPQECVFELVLLMHFT